MATNMPISKPTVLILGAGASAPYGFPVGTMLRDEVCALPRNAPCLRLLSEVGHGEAAVRDFTQELLYSGYASVDAFLEKNPAFLPIGKHVIAALLLPRETEATLFPIGGHSSPEHWYQTLLSHMAVGTEDWQANQLSVITFNYDRSFEHYFTRVISQRSQVPLEAAHEQFAHVPVVHVHGSLGGYPQSAPSGLAYGQALDARTVSVAAGRLLVVSEAEDTLPTFDAAYALLRTAARVYFLGFGFHPDNVRRLRFFAAPGDQVDPYPLIWGSSAGITESEWGVIQYKVLNGHWNGIFSPKPVNVFLRRHASLD